jgi:hypothetical protein
MVAVEDVTAAVMGGAEAVVRHARRRLRKRRWSAPTTSTVSSPSSSPAEVTSRDENCSFCWWAMEVLFDGESNMYLHTGRNKFTRAHDIDIGCLVNFFYEGDNEMSVKVFDNESFRIHYHDNDSGGNNDDDGNEEDEG